MNIFVMVTTIISLLTAFAAVIGPIWIAKINSNSAIKAKKLELEAKELEVVYTQKFKAFQAFTSCFETFREYQNENTAALLNDAAAKVCLLAPPNAKEKIMNFSRTAQNNCRLTPQLESLYQECLALLNNSLNGQK